MKNIIFFLGILTTFALAEIVSQRIVIFSSPLTDNNSFILKKRFFDKTPILNDHAIFLGSSFFARGIDCSLNPNFPCFNLSIDGGDADSYLFTVKNVLKDTRPRMIIVELSQIVVAHFDYSLPAIEGYIKTPLDHLSSYSSRGLTLEFKQALKNQIDSYLIWSGVNYYSRRNRLTEWPEVIEEKLFPHQATDVASYQIQFEVSSYFNPDPEKIESFRLLIEELNHKNIPLIVVATPDRYEGILDNPIILKSKTYEQFFKWEQEKKLHFIVNLTQNGLPVEAMTDELNHLDHKDSQLFFEILVRLIKEKMP